MKYQIHITKTAERDLIAAADYIEFSLKNPSAADDLLELAEERISQLSYFPEKHPIIDEPVLYSWEIRFIVINNYLAFYKIIGDKVYILRFLYEKRDWISILEHDSM